jgi:hypothetical protein
VRGGSGARRAAAGRVPAEALQHRLLLGDRLRTRGGRLLRATSTTAVLIQMTFQTIN